MAIAPLMSSADSRPKVSASAAATSGTSAEALMNNFMTLLVAQMQNQDPTNPMDNNQLTTQLAQFNTASGVQQLNSTLNNVGTLVTSMQQMNAAEWVGRSVLVEGTPEVENAESAEANKSFAFSLPEHDADTVTVTLTDTAGNAYRATLQNVKAGTHSYTLDDLKNFEPSAPPAGATYTVSFAAADSNGDAPAIVALKKAKVESVAFSSTGALLQLGVDGTATLNKVYEID